VESISHKSHRLLKDLLGRAFPFLKWQSSQTCGVTMNMLQAKFSQLPRSHGDWVTVETDGNIVPKKAIKHRPSKNNLISVLDATISLKMTAIHGSPMRPS
jgi:hypothetical protein